ncbi:MAG: hypothetical protein M3Y28_05480 [Armatimonadota bacterium]|nr:hypothetical protein [Armatimonadota bacterium]
MRFNKLRLVDNDAANDLEDSAEDYDLSSVSEDGDAAETASVPTNRALLFIVVSAACAAAAVAAGSYAVWLSRQRVARETLTNVQDILKTCQDRMHQMEDDLNRLPHGFSSSSAA